MPTGELKLCSSGSFDDFLDLDTNSGDNILSVNALDFIVDGIANTHLAQHRPARISTIGNFNTDDTDTSANSFGHSGHGSPESVSSGSSCEESKRNSPIIPAAEAKAPEEKKGMDADVKEVEVEAVESKEAKVHDAKAEVLRKAQSEKTTEVAQKSKLFADELSLMGRIIDNKEPSCQGSELTVFATLIQYFISFRDASVELQGTYSEKEGEVREQVIAPIFKYLHNGEEYLNSVLRLLIKKYTGEENPNPPPSWHAKLSVIEALAKKVQEDCANKESQQIINTPKAQEEAPVIQHETTAEAIKRNTGDYYEGFLAGCAKLDAADAARAELLKKQECKQPMNWQWFKLRRSGSDWQGLREDGVFALKCVKNLRRHPASQLQPQQHNQDNEAKAAAVAETKVLANAAH